MWSLKKLSALLVAFVLTCILWLYLKDLGQVKETTNNSVQSDLVFRLRKLDVNFHKFVALISERDSPSEEAAIENEEPIVKTTTTLKPSLLNPRWRISESYYKTFLLKHNLTQSRRKCTENYKMLILVQSYITHTSRRDSIRRTWGNCSTKNPNYRWKVLFIIGKTTQEGHPQLLAKEMSHHNDILLFNTGESFYNLTEKLQKSFQWITTFCRFHYLLKADDDVFVNIAALFEYLDQEKMPKTELFTGQVMWWSEVYRSGRYAIDKGYKRDVYPRYCSGGGYVLSRDVVDKFVALFKDVPYMRIDDAYFGELALKVGLYIIHSDNFRMWTSDCDFKDTGIVTHPVKDDQCMKDMFFKSSAAFSRIGEINHSPL